MLIKVLNHDVTLILGDATFAVVNLDFQVTLKVLFRLIFFDFVEVKVETVLRNLNVVHFLVIRTFS